MNYYSENEQFCVDWLKNLIAEKLIPEGDVDDRDIRDVRPVDLKGYTQCHFFAGIGGWPLALRTAAWPDNREVWTGSCPCQPFSAAGRRRGFADERHLWPFWYWLIGQRRPATIFGEQVASAIDWLRLVRGDLEALDYAVGAMPVEAASAGADHLRNRFWFVADDGFGRRPGSGAGQVQQPGRAEAERAGDSSLGHADRAGLPQRTGDERVQRETMGAPEGKAAGRAGNSGHLAQSFGADQRRYAGSTRVEAGARSDEAWAAYGNAADGSRTGSSLEWVISADGKARRVKPGVRLLVDGFPNRVGLLRGFGNAIDPRPAAEFIGAYLDG